jgi:hypothetical protein
MDYIFWYFWFLQDEKKPYTLSFNKIQYLDDSRDKAGRQAGRQANMHEVYKVSRQVHGYSYFILRTNRPLT